MSPRFASGLVLLVTAAAPLAAQQWNAPDAVALANAGVERRREAQADSTLARYRTRAHGLVFFLAQVGEEGLSEPPRLVKADELQVEVYWRAPNESKQRILGWRDGAFLPTDISYHRDHLGIVTNNFGDLIRIGEGDEVRDVPHPLSEAGLALYDFALTDSVSVEGAGGSIRLRALAVRPKDFSRPLVIGTLFLDAATSQLVRFRFSFTSSAYLDRQLEDITITLQNSLWDERYWLPYRQEVKIRRRFSWLEFPARGIIRGRWEIDDYDLNADFPDAVFAGPPIAGLRRPGGADSLFDGPLAEAITAAGRPLDAQDMAATRAEIERYVGRRSLSGLPASRLGGGGLSDFVRVNRVQGLALGGAAVVGLRKDRLDLRPFIGIGTADGRVTGGARLAFASGATRLFASASRQVRDFSDLPVTAPAVNSLTSQEFGDDYGDWLLLDEASAGIERRLGGRHGVALAVALERSRSLEVEASPANGEYRPNPLFGAEAYRVGRLSVTRASGGSVAARSDLHGALRLEGGTGPTDYLRGALEARWTRSVGPAELVGRLYGVAGSAGMPAWRAMALGGRGTLVGEPFRAFGGRRALLAHAEWRFRVPAPAIPLGSFASTGATATLAPFAAVGWSGGGVAGMPWDPDGGARPVAGVALELFMRLLRVEAGVALRTGHFGVTVDVSRDWWGAL
jgi:hypothetical protein